jgi:membrane associated rhomboid family serine protease
MYKQYRPPSHNALPMVIKNLLIVNGLLFLATIVLKDRKVLDLTEILGLHFPLSAHFRPYQLITYMFMHGSLNHLFFNMLSLWMFGSTIENFWGWKRFSIYYVVTALGGAALYLLVKYIEFSQLKGLLSADLLYQVIHEGTEVIDKGYNFSNANAAQLNLLINIPVVGASGAIYGILLAFAMMFPNTELVMLFFPIPIKAKYFVIIMGAMELFLGANNNPGDNVAHFAHLGGMLFGYILIKYWNKKNRTTFY